MFFILQECWESDGKGGAITYRNGKKIGPERWMLSHVADGADHSTGDPVSFGSFEDARFSTDYNFAHNPIVIELI